MAITPVTQGQYGRYMDAYWDERDLIDVATGFQAIIAKLAGRDPLFSDDASVVDIDIIRGNERTSKLVPRGPVARSIGSSLESLNEQKFTEVNRAYPLGIEIFDLYAGQLNKRVRGELVSQPLSRQERLRVLAIAAMKETTRRQVRMMEYLASQSLRTGKQDAILSEAVPTYDWSRNANLTITVGTKWDASGDVLADLDTACDRIRQYGHQQAKIVVFGKTALAAALENTAFAALADNRRLGFIQLGMGAAMPAEYGWMAEAGFNYRGEILTPHGYTLSAYTYNEGYDNASGVYTPYMPVDETFVFAPSARCDRYFGPPETMPLMSAQRQFYADAFGMTPEAIPSIGYQGTSRVVMPSMFYNDAYPNSDGSTITHRSQVAPIFATTHVDAFALLDGCV